MEAVEYFLLPIPAPFEVSCFRVCFRFLTLEIFCFRFRLRIKLVASEFPSPSSSFCQNASSFLQNFTASSFRFLRFLRNCMLTAQHKTENLVCRKSVKFTILTDTIKWGDFNQFESCLI